LPFRQLIDFLFAANFTLPVKCGWIDEVIYPELGEEEAKAIVEGFHKEAKAAGVTKEKEKRDRSASRDGPPNKRPRDDRRHRDDRRLNREFQRDRGKFLCYSWFLVRRASDKSGEMYQ
jgi:hypothetical protein